MTAKNVGIPAYILASNLLAGEYLLQVLEADKFVRPILCKQLPQARVKSVPTVFIVEGSFVPLPLSDCVRRLRTLFPKARFVMVDKARPPEEILRIIRMGFHWFVEHSKVADSLASAVHAVVNGRVWRSDELAHSYTHFSSEKRLDPSDSPKSPTLRETEVLELVRQRLSNKEIAEILEVSENTVKYHLRNILSKFGAGGRRELEKPRSRTADVWEQLSRIH